MRVFGELPIELQEKPNVIARLIVRVKVQWRLWLQRREIKRAANQVIADVNARRSAMGR